MFQPPEWVRNRMNAEAEMTEAIRESGRSPHHPRSRPPLWRGLAILLVLGPLTFVVLWLLG